MITELTLAEAADAAGVTKKTMVRRNKAGEFPNARQDASGRWLVPPGDLIAAGFELQQPDDTDDTTTMSSDTPVIITEDTTITATTDEVIELRAEVADLRRRAEVAEAVAEERGKALEDTRMALRALTVASSTPDPASAAQSIGETRDPASAPAIPTPPGSSMRARLRGWLSG